MLPSIIADIPRYSFQRPAGELEGRMERLFQALGIPPPQPGLKMLLAGSVAGRQRHSQLLL